MNVLISVSDKSGIVAFSKELIAMGAKIISTGGTLEVLRKNGIPAGSVTELTGFPECLDGRVKTLHPAVHGGILAMRDRESHMRQLEELRIGPIDMVVINLYPFRRTIANPDVSLEEAIENIDIGGPAMLRSAAKNHKDVTVLCDPGDYEKVLEEWSKLGEVSYNTRYRLALKVFEHTAACDAMIAEFLRKRIEAPLPDNLTLTFEKIQELRYGENPHQKASYYREILPAPGTFARGEKLQGKELSFNNIHDSEGALAALKEFDGPAAVAVKHANPCGVGCGDTLVRAFRRACEADPVSIFGGIVAVNRPVDQATAAEISKIFVEVLLAPEFTPEAREILAQKPNLRLIRIERIGQQEPEEAPDMKKVGGGLLVQEKDRTPIEKETWEVVTKKQPTAEEYETLRFAMKVAKHVKSNGIVVARGQRTLGIGPGQVNRIWAVENALRQATGETRGAVLASDAFFPFDDCVEAAAAAGISAIVQPGGSVNDEDSIRKADELGVAMVFTGVRHFKH